MKSSLRTLGSGVLLALGVVALLSLVREAGPTAVLTAVSESARWLPLLLFLELLGAALDAQAARVLHFRGDLHSREAVEPVRSIRGVLLAYAAAQTAPGGRMVGEVLRAAELAPRVGKVRAGFGALVLQGLHVLGVSAMAFSAAAMLGDPLLRGLTLATALWTLVLGTVLVLSPRSARIAAWLGRRSGLGLLDAPAPSFDLGRIARAGGYLGAARMVHLAQAGVVLVAVLGRGSIESSFTAEAIQLVAANVGDAIPGQLGVLEATFRTFGESLACGLPVSSAMGHAVVIALLLRTCRLGLASTAGLLLLLSRSPRLAALLAGITLVLTPIPTLAQDEAPDTRVVAHQRLVLVVNPMGAEHLVSVGASLPLSDGRDVLLDGTHLEGGAISYVSPIYAMTGGYLELSPLVFLVLRAEVLSVGMWPIGIDGAGFYPLESEPETLNLPGVEGQFAAGVNVQLSATLQLAVSRGVFRPILFSQTTVEYERVGEQSHRYSPRYDLVLAREDWMIASSNLLLLEVRASREVALRVGGFDDLRVVPRSGYLNHVLGPVIMLVLTELDRAVPELLLFVRAGAHVDESRRRGEWTGLLGLLGSYEG